MKIKSGPLSFYLKYQDIEFTESTILQLSNIISSNKRFLSNELIVPVKLCDYNDYTKTFIDNKIFSPILFLVTLSSIISENDQDILNSELENPEEYTNFIGTNLYPVYEKFQEYITEYLKFYIGNRQLQFVLEAVNPNRIFNSFFKLLNLEEDKIKFQTSLVRISFFELLISELCIEKPSKDKLPREHAEFLKNYLRSLLSSNISDNETETIRRLIRNMKYRITKSNADPYNVLSKSGDVYVENRNNEVFEDSIEENTSVLYSPNKIKQLYNNFLGDFLNEQTSIKSLKNFCNGKFIYLKGSTLIVNKRKGTLQKFVYFMDKFFEKRLNLISPNYVIIIYYSGLMVRKSIGIIYIMLD